MFRHMQASVARPSTGEPKSPDGVMQDTRPIAHRARTAATKTREGTMVGFLRRFALATSLTACVLGVLAIAPATGAPSAQTCGAREVSQPFLPWLDFSHYFLLPGGDFESSSGWILGGGAKISAGNEPFYVHGKGDAKSLSLPSGAWARTAAICVDSDEPTLRFFARNSGSLLSTLVVEARIRTTLLGVTTETSLPVGVVLGTARTWQPSLPMVFKLSLNQLLGGTTTIDFRFSVLGSGGAWRVDDVYIDPFKDR